MRKAAVFLALLFLAVAIPSLSFTEDRATVELARAVYALARDDGYSAKLAVASVAVNRVADPWFPSTLSGVLSEKHQFPIGARYDADSLRAAHEALSGNTSLPKDVLYYQSAGGGWGSEYLYSTIGDLAFYTRDGNR